MSFSTSSVLIYLLLLSFLLLGGSHNNRELLYLNSPIGIFYLVGLVSSQAEQWSVFLEFRRPLFRIETQKQFQKQYPLPYSQRGCRRYLGRIKSAL